MGRSPFPFREGGRGGGSAPRPSRRALLGALALGGVGALLAACQPPAALPAPGGAPTRPGAALSPLAATAPNGPASADWEPAWNALVEAAQREGKVVVKGPPSPDARTDLPRAFRERFGIEVEYLGGPTGPFATQLVNERQAGVYTTDVVLAGADSMYTVFYGERLLEPLPPVLIHPLAADPTAWPDGKLWFMDPEQQYVLRLNNAVLIMGQINTAHARPEELTSWHDLLKPEFRGKLAGFDPTVTGTGVGFAAYLWVTLGEDYVRQLYLEQRPALSRDDRQLADWVVRGTYPMVLGGEYATEAAVADFRASGVSVVNLPSPADAPGRVSPGFGLLSLLTHAPHPNAARLFVNWVAMPEGMAVWSKAIHQVPVRLDVDKSPWPRDLIPDPARRYHDSFGWDFTLTERQLVMTRLRELLR